jgi:hypothetical protein
LKKNKHGNWHAGDMIIFEDTGEWCVLHEKFDIYVSSEKDNLEKKRWHQPSWAWKAEWGTMPGSWKQMDAGGRYGISHINLSNCAQPAFREGSVVRVRSSSPYKNCPYTKARLQKS